MNIEGILAHDQNHLIGIKDTIPWKHKGDLQRFKSITMGHNLLMGPKTFFGIAKLLQGRQGATVLPGRTIFLLAQPRKKVAAAEVPHIHRRGFGADWVQLVNEVVTACRQLGVSYDNVRVVLRDGTPREILDRIEMIYLKNNETLFVAGGSAIYDEYLEFCSTIHQTIMGMIVDPFEEDLNKAVFLTPKTIEILNSEIWIPTLAGIDGPATYMTLTC